MANELKRRLIMLLATMGGAACAYYVLLNEEARKEVAKTLETLLESYKKVAGTISNKKGVVIEGDLPNRERVLRQWEQLNY